MSVEIPDRVITLRDLRSQLRWHRTVLVLLGACSGLGLPVTPLPPDPIDEAWADLNSIPSTVERNTK
jgi:hypothetical protein